MSGATPEAISAAVEEILGQEGGWVDNPTDRGGPTNFGITLPELSIYLGRQASIADLQSLTRDAAAALYSKLYITDTGFCAINDPALLTLVADCAVNHGATRAAQWLQGAVGAAVDGHFGPVSQTAVNASGAPTTYRAVLASRARFYGQIVAHDATQATFDGGWMSRLADFIVRCP